jgi:hypothetical protein
MAVVEWGAAIGGGAGPVLILEPAQLERSTHDTGFGFAIGLK